MDQVFSTGGIPIDLAAELAAFYECRPGESSVADRVKQGLLQFGTEQWRAARRQEMDRLQAARPAAEEPQLETSVKLTAEQQAALETVLDAIGGAIPDPPLCCAITGGAGTGKTTLTRELARELADDGLAVGYAAPTHKACGVMAAALGVERESVLTVASLLGLRETTDGDKADFKPIADHRLDEAEVWIIDESSMIHPEHLALMRSNAGMNQAFIFIGDAAQLPPVKHNESPALRQKCTATLTKVHRHAGAVLDLATAIRTGDAIRPKISETVHYSGSSVITHDTLQSWQRTFFEIIKDAGEGDPDAARILAYRNRVVSYDNAAIRYALLGPDALPFVAGERLVANGGVFTPEAAEGRGNPVFASCRELTIERVERGMVRININRAENGEWERDSKSRNGMDVDCYQLHVRADRWAPTDAITTRLLAAVDPSRVEREIEALRAEAKITRRWHSFWILLRSFPKLNRHWAMTVHKSQGSQFRQVFIEAQDLDSAQSDDRRRLWYTAVTRATEAVHVLRDF